MALLKERDITFIGPIHRGDIVIATVTKRQGSQAWRHGQDVEYTCTRAYTEEAWELQQIQNLKVKEMQGLTDMTMRSNVAANGLISLEERERIAKMKSKAKHSGEKWHMAMASVAHDVTKETQNMETRNKTRK